MTTVITSIQNCADDLANSIQRQEKKEKKKPRGNYMSRINRQRSVWGQEEQDKRSR